MEASRSVLCMHFIGLVRNFYDKFFVMRALPREDFDCDLFWAIRGAEWRRCLFGSVSGWLDENPTNATLSFKSGKGRLGHGGGISGLILIVLSWYRLSVKVAGKLDAQPAKQR